MALKRMDNVLLVVEDLEAVKEFFLRLGLVLEGEATVEGPMVGELIGLKDVRATLAMLRPPDGQGGIELDKFHTPAPVRYGPVETPVNALGYRRVMFSVEGIDDVVARMRAHGADLIGEMRYGDSYRLAYIRGPEGILVGLAEEIGKPARRTDRKAAGKSAPGKKATGIKATRTMAEAKRAKRPGSGPGSKPGGRKKAARKGGGARTKRRD